MQPDHNSQPGMTPGVNQAAQSPGAYNNGIIQAAPQPPQAFSPIGAQPSANPLMQQGLRPPMSQGVPDIGPQALPARVDIAPQLSQAAPQAPAMAQVPVAGNARLPESVNDADDSEWIVRAKQVVSSTAGDPHRQVQLMQHLRAQYLKQRFGRTVHTDKA